MPLSIYHDLLIVICSGAGKKRYLKPIHKAELIFKSMREASIPKNLSKALTLQDILLASRAGLLGKEPRHSLGFTSAIS